MKFLLATLTILLQVFFSSVSYGFYTETWVGAIQLADRYENIKEFDWNQTQNFTATTTTLSFSSQLVALIQSDQTRITNIGDFANLVLTVDYNQSNSQVNSFAVKYYNNTVMSGNFSINDSVIFAPKGKLTSFDLNGDVLSYNNGIFIGKPALSTNVNGIYNRDNNIITSVDMNGTLQTVPEPSSYILMIASMAIMIVVRKLRKSS